VTATAAAVLAALEAHPRSAAWEVAEATGLPVNVVSIALRQLEALGRVVRGEDEHAIVIWTAVCPKSAA
jgi:DNA-binding IclR family transcriptional regulator